MSSATTSAPPMTRIHSRTARPTRLRWPGVVRRPAIRSSVEVAAPRGSCAPRSSRPRRAGFAGDPAPGRSREHRTPRPVPIGRRAPRPPRSWRRTAGRPPGPGPSSAPRSRPGPGRRPRRARRRSPRGAAAGTDEDRACPRRGRRPRPGRARRRAVGRVVAQAPVADAGVGLVRAGGDDRPAAEGGRRVDDRRHLERGRAERSSRCPTTPGPMPPRRRRRRRSRTATSSADGT